MHYNSVMPNATKIARKIESQRRVLQYMHQNEYEQALVKLKEQIRLSEGSNMQERMKEQLRQWFLQCRYSLKSHLSLFKTRIRIKICFR